MKTASDPRHKKREKAIRALFRWSFQEKQVIKSNLAKVVLTKVKTIDKIITKSSIFFERKSQRKSDIK